MEAPKILIDTSIIIDFLRKKNKEKTLFWEIINKYDCYISSITEFELFCGATTSLKIKELNTLFSYLSVIDFSSELARQASSLFLQLKGKNRLIEFRDIFIAATAINYEMKLATLNVKHFKRIPHLNLF